MPRLWESLAVLAVPPEPEAAAEPEEDLMGGGPVLQDAIDAATKLISEGKSAEVKAALAAVGAKRVSELGGDTIARFIAQVS